jgi:hypothetical protein
MVARPRVGPMPPLLVRASWAPSGTYNIIPSVMVMTMLNRISRGQCKHINGGGSSGARKPKV